MHKFSRTPGNTSTSLRPRASPLGRAAALTGRYGSENGDARVAFSLRHPVSIVSIKVRENRIDLLSDVMKQLYDIDCLTIGQSMVKDDIALHWGGHEQWYTVAQSRPEGALYTELSSALDGATFCCDQSHGRIILTISGSKARDLLAKGTAMDLHPSIFASGCCAVTRMAHVDVHLACVAPDSYELSLARSFAEGFWGWLTQQAAEYGYVVR